MGGGGGISPWECHTTPTHRILHLFPPGWQIRPTPHLFIGEPAECGKLAQFIFNALHPHFELKGRNDGHEICVAGALSNPIHGALQPRQQVENETVTSKESQQSNQHANVNVLPGNKLHRPAFRGDTHHGVHGGMRL